MIVRIMSEGQWDIDSTLLPELNRLDDAVALAVHNNDEVRLRQALAQLHQQVREHGGQLPEDSLTDSDLILPATDATLAEVSAWLDGTGSSEGLIPDADSGQAANPE